MNALDKILKRTEGLRIFSDEQQKRVCIPVASSQIIFEKNQLPVDRCTGEILDIVETIFGGKFMLPLEATAGLEPASGRTTSGSIGRKLGTPVASIEIWSLEPGSYDLVLRLPNHVAQNETLCAPLIGRFIDQAREVGRTVDNLDLLRFHSGPTLSLSDAHRRLNRLERDSGTRLDTENLWHILNRNLTLPN